MEEEESKAYQQLEFIAAKLKGGDELPAVTLRELLSWFGTSQCGWHKLMMVEEALDEHSLYTSPELQDASLDGEVTFKLSRDYFEGLSSTEAKYKVPQPTLVTAPPKEQHIEQHIEIEAVANAIGGYAVRRLKSANTPLISVPLDAALQEVVTIMLTNDISQLPVMQNDYDLKGVISWRSLGIQLALNRRPLMARDCMEPSVQIHASDDVFDVIGRIIENQYALVQSDDKRYTGIVTTSDLSEILRDWAEPFLLIGEIESRIRLLMRPCFEFEDIKSSLEDQTYEIKGIEDLTIGQCVRLLQKPENWIRLNLALDRNEFLRHLEQVRDIRNDIVHLDLDSFEVEELRALRNFLKLLKQINDLQPSFSDYLQTSFIK